MNELIHNIKADEGALGIAQDLELLIRDGRLASGERLPAVRDLAQEIGVCPATVAAAYRRLRERGLVHARGRAGTRVAPRSRMPGPELEAPATLGLVDLATGNPDPNFLPPFGPELADLDPAIRLYGEAPIDPLLEQRARRAFEKEGLPAGEFAVIGGALDAIERLLRDSLLPGDAVAVEDPGFSGVIELVRGLGLVPEPVAMDSEGPTLEGLERALARGARAFVVTPRAHNPTGAVVSSERAKLLRRRLADFSDLLLIEDDHAGPVSGVPLATLCGSTRRWAFVRSTSKWLGPDMRLALVLGDEGTIRRLEAGQLLGIRWVSLVLQSLAERLWKRRSNQALFKQAAKSYAERRKVMREALAKRGIEVDAASGLNLWVPVREELNVVLALRERGWAVCPGESFRIHSAPGIRISIAALDAADAEDFAEDLAQALNPARKRTRA